MLPLSVYHHCHVDCILIDDKPVSMLLLFVYEFVFPIMFEFFYLPFYGCARVCDVVCSVRARARACERDRFSVLISR